MACAYLFVVVIIIVVGIAADDTDSTLTSRPLDLLLSVVYVVNHASISFGMHDLQ